MYAAGAVQVDLPSTDTVVSASPTSPQWVRMSSWPRAGMVPTVTLRNVILARTSESTSIGVTVHVASPIPQLISRHGPPGGGGTGAGGQAVNARSTAVSGMEDRQTPTTPPVGEQTAVPAHKGLASGASAQALDLKVNRPCCLTSLPSFGLFGTNLASNKDTTAMPAPARNTMGGE